MRLALGPGARDIAGDEVGDLALLIARHLRPRTEQIPTFPTMPYEASRFR
jgi:hypothetical protein